MDKARKSPFRRAALDSAAGRLTGDVLAKPVFSHVAFVSTIAVILMLLTAWACFSAYSRTLLVTGWTEPSSGVVTVDTRFQGVAEKLYVAQGDVVQEGQPLVKLFNYKFSDATTNVNKMVAHEAQTQVSQYSQKLSLIETRKTTQLHALDINLKLQKAQIELIDSEILALREKKRILNNQLRRIEQLGEQRFVSRYQSEGITILALEADAALARLGRDKLLIKAALNEMELEQNELLNELVSEQLDIKNDMSRARQQLAEINSLTSTIIHAPTSGIVSTVEVREKQSLTGEPARLLTIVPSDSKPIVKLRIPVSSKGVEINQTANIRLDAYPYETYGTLQGTVSSVTLAPSSITGLHTKDASEQAYYLIEAILAEDVRLSSGDTPQIKPGMTLTAEIVIGSTTIVGSVLSRFYR